MNKKQARVAARKAHEEAIAIVREVYYEARAAAEKTCDSEEAIVAARKASVEARVAADKAYEEAMAAIAIIEEER